jgi:hypothetical protein
MCVGQQLPKNISRSSSSRQLAYISQGKAQVSLIRKYTLSIGANSLPDSFLGEIKAHVCKKTLFIAVKD